MNTTDRQETNCTWTPMTMTEQKSMAMTEVFRYRAEDSRSVILFSVTRLKFLIKDYR